MLKRVALDMDWERGSFPSLDNHLRAIVRQPEFACGHQKIHLHCVALKQTRLHVTQDDPVLHLVLLVMEQQREEWYDVFHG
jgi:hypothetical protein